MSAVSSSAAIGLRYDFNGGKKHIYFPNTDPRQLEEFGFAIRNKQKYLLKKIDLKVRRVTPPTVCIIVLTDFLSPFQANVLGVTEAKRYCCL